MIQEGSFARVRADVPVFQDAHLTTPDVVHVSVCAQRLDEVGAPRGTTCTCFSTQRRLMPGDVIQIVRMTEMSLLVDPQRGRSVCWIEVEGVDRKAVKNASQPDTRRSRSPADFLVLDEVLLDHAPTLTRRRRVPHGGEIVFVRSELKDRPMPYRLFCTHMSHDGSRLRVAVLTDPQLFFDQVLDASWTQRREVTLEGEIEKTLVPAYPLYDGRPDPGWG